MLRSKWCLSMVLSLACASSAARAEDPKPAPTGPHFTLTDALRVMRAEHPRIVAANHGIEAAKADARAARLWTNPTGSVQYTPAVKNNSYDRAGYVGYGITQFIELSNVPKARGQVAQLGVVASEADRKALVLSLSLAVESALIDVVAAERRVQIIEHALELLEEAAGVVEKRFSAGAAPRYDKTRIGVTMATAYSDLDEARAIRHRAWAELAAAVGPGMGALRGAPEFPLDTVLKVPEAPALQDLLERQRPDLLAAQERYRAAQAQVSAARRNIFPGVGVSALGGFGQSPGQVDVGVGLTLALPVVDRGQAAIPAAQRRVLQAEADRAALLQPAKQRVAGIRDEVMARQRAMEDFSERATVSGDEMLEEAQAGYLAGRFSVLELADAYSAWRESQLRAVDLAAAARQAEVDLEREVGSMLRQ